MSKGEAKGEKKAEEGKNVLYVVWGCTLKFRDKLIGGIPKHPGIIAGWLKSLKPPLEDLVDETIKKMKPTEEEVEKELSEKEKKAWTGFARNEKGFYIEERHIKAMLKYAARQWKLTTSIKGLLESLKGGVFVKPEQLPIGDKEDGHVEVAGHVRTPAGQRDILRRADYVTRKEISFDLWVVNNRVISDKNLRILFNLGQESGLGSMRSMGYGKFDVLTLQKKGTVGMNTSGKLLFYEEGYPNKGESL